MVWDELATDESIKNTVNALNANGISTIVVENGAAAKEEALRIIPKGIDVLTVTSATLDAISLAKELNESGMYDSVRNKLFSLDRNTQRKEMLKLGTAPSWVVGSVHALTEDGKVIIASATGSQIPADAYGAEHVIWIVGTQKIVKDLDQGMKRIYEYALPLESERARKAYGMAGSSVAKLLIINKEYVKDRITIILVKEVLGF
jgi:L-lactate utilization protein LutC